MMNFDSDLFLSDAAGAVAVGGGASDELLLLSPKPDVELLPAEPAYPPVDAQGAVAWGAPPSLILAPDAPEEPSPDSSSSCASGVVSSPDSYASPPVAPTQGLAPARQQQQQQLEPVAKAKGPLRTSDVLPTGVALPAILGGKMPAPSRKRKRKHSPESEGEDSDDPDRLAIRLPRDTLLSLTSAQMSRYVRYMRESQKLTPGQQKELKQQKRLVKNRESARLSRQRKQDHISTLEGQIAELRNEMEALRGQNQALLQENQRLNTAIRQQAPSAHRSVQQQLAQQQQQQLLAAQQQQQQQQQLQQQQQQQRQMLRTSSYGDLETPALHHAARFATSASSSSSVDGVPSRTLRAAGVCIFVIMFSFGLFFRASADMDSGVVIKREIIPRVMVSPSVRILDPAGGATARSPRILQEYTHPEAIPSPHELPGPLEHDPDDLDVPGRPSWATRAKIVDSWVPQELTYLVTRELTRVDPSCGASCTDMRLGLLVPLNLVASSCNQSQLPENFDVKEHFVELICRVDTVSVVPRAAIESAAATATATASATVAAKGATPSASPPPPPTPNV